MGQMVLTLLSCSVYSLNYVDDSNCYSFSLLVAGIMICVFHTPGVKHGRDQWDMILLMNGGHGLPMDKLLGTSFIFPLLITFSWNYN